MRELLFLLLFIARPASPQTQPKWMDVFSKLNDPKSQNLPLGSLDQEVHKAWAAALAAGPLHPQFEAAAHQTAQYFSNQGYSRKAESTLHQAIAAVKQADSGAPDQSRAQTLALSLAQRLIQEQRFIAASAILQQILQDSAATPRRRAVLLQLANTKEQMGEIGSIETLLIEANSIPQFQFASNRLIPSPGIVAGSFPRGSAGTFYGSLDLASFYIRQGQPAKAEAVYKDDLAGARTPQEAFQTRQSYAHFLNSQQRWDDSIVQWQKLLELQSASPRLEDQQMLSSIRASLAQTLISAGKPDAGLELLKQHITKSGTDPNQRFAALSVYANALLQQMKLGEAEKVAEQMRETSTEFSSNAADHLFAQIRQLQNRPDEAKAFYLKTTQQPNNSNPANIWNSVQPVHELLQRHKYDEAISQLQRILAAAAPGIQTNPEHINAFTGIIQMLPPGRSEERLQLARNILSTLDGIPATDHPRIAQALSQFVSNMTSSGMPHSQLSSLIDRQEKIISSSKGDDSMSLNEVSRQRARLHTSRGDYAEAATELKRALKRSAAVSGPKSQPTLQIMRELCESLQADSENWPEEEALRIAVIEASSSSSAMWGSPIHDMNTLANRYNAMGDREKALAWMDRAIEIAAREPHPAEILQHFQQQRKYFAAQQPQP